MSRKHGVRKDKFYYTVWYDDNYVGSASTLSEANWLFSYYQDKQKLPLKYRGVV